MSQIVCDPEISIRRLPNFFGLFGDVFPPTVLLYCPSANVGSVQGLTRRHGICLTPVARCTPVPFTLPNVRKTETLLGASRLHWYQVSLPFEVACRVYHSATVRNLQYGNRFQEAFAVVCTTSPSTGITRMSPSRYSALIQCATFEPGLCLRFGSFGDRYLLTLCAPRLFLRSDKR